MSLNDDATLVVGTGHIYLAPTLTDYPDDVTAPGVPWTELGHTSLSDIFTWDQEGGETSTLGTLQNPNLRTRRSAVVDTMGLTLQQFDEGALKLYFGANAVKNADGWLELPVTAAPTITAMLIVFVDGTATLPIYMPKVEILRGDAPSIESTEDLAGLPINIKPLKDSTKPAAVYIKPIVTTP